MTQAPRSFLLPQEQTHSEDDLIGERDRPRRQPNKSVRNEALLARWIRRRRAALRRAIPERRTPKERLRLHRCTTLNRRSNSGANRLPWPNDRFLIR